MNCDQCICYKSTVFTECCLYTKKIINSIPVIIL